MLSLQERIETLEKDLLAQPIRISAYHNLPFAILRYEPQDEFAVRKQISLFVTRLQNAGNCVTVISLARILWRAIEETEGIKAIAQGEKQFGFARTQETVSTLLSDEDFKPLAGEILVKMKDLDPAKDVVFLVRAGAMGPAIYRMARLLDELYGKIMVPVILFYPGTLESESSLRYLDLPEREQTGAYNYRVKIY